VRFVRVEFAVVLDPNYARERQRRLLPVMQQQKLDAVVLGSTRHVYYFTAHLPFWLHHVGFVLFADGRSTLVAAGAPQTKVASDSVTTYEASWEGTQRQEQPVTVAGLLFEMLATRGAARIGIDASAVSAALAMNLEGEAELIDPQLWQLRRRKDPDELALMRVAIDCTRAMYERARQIIQPGILELEVFQELHSVAVRVAGEPLSAHLGNDYACGVPGGPPRKDRTAQSGELYILDLGPAYRGYFSDNCRTIAVNRKPTDEQMRACEIVTSALPIVERMARPGVRCREIYEAVDQHYRAATGKAFPYHLGHGVGLQPHEFPHLNPKWDDVLIEDEVFTAEPGLYRPELKGGLRIENQYVVTRDGVTNLTPFPTELV
jgi:Xaa-Pro dipeptidase